MTAFSEEPESSSTTTTPAPTPTTPTTPTPRIVLADPDEWEDADPANVRAVLESVAEALLARAPNAAADMPAVVVRARGGPIALYEMTAEGHWQVNLNTGGRYWCQYTYQFAHELCHLLCRAAGVGADADHNEAGNPWFEEALCETASLFVLRRMADAWEASPPYSNWEDYAQSLREYAARRLADSPRPADEPLAAWYARNRTQLAPYNRSHDLPIAAALLPLFEARPEGWAALRWLNVDVRPRAFRDHLAAWRRRVPPVHAPIVDAIAAAFGEALAERNGDGVDAAGLMARFEEVVRESKNLKVGAAITHRLSISRILIHPFLHAWK